MMTWLAINYDKFAIIPVNCSKEKISRLKARLGCLVVSLPTTYLGIPLGANRNRVATWKPIIDKIEKKLSWWRTNLLPKAGRLVLIRIILNSPPNYYLSLFKMSKAISKKIISLQSKFFWCKNNEKRGIATVSWNQIQMPKEARGLGVGDILIKSAAILFKWRWRFSIEEKPL